VSSFDPPRYRNFEGVARRCASQRRACGRATKPTFPGSIADRSRPAAGPDS
jgi:hypothetical protein